MYKYIYIYIYTYIHPFVNRSLLTNSHAFDVQATHFLSAYRRCS